jgi:hypothetical protein
MCRERDKARAHARNQFGRCFDHYPEAAAPEMAQITGHGPVSHSLLLQPKNIKASAHCCNSMTTSEAPTLT